jgi:hypothetical protein
MRRFCRIDSQHVGCCKFNSAPDPSKAEQFVFCPATVVDKDACPDPFFKGAFSDVECPTAKGPPYLFKFDPSNPRPTMCSCEKAGGPNCPTPKLLAMYPRRPKPIPVDPSSSVSTLFASWMSAYAPPRLARGAASPAEDKAKLAAFTESVDTIKAHQAGPLAGSFTLALNEFAATPPAEFSKRFGLKAPSPQQRKKLLQKHAAPPRLAKSAAAGAEPPLPWALNWALKGSVTRSQDQGNCGYCFIYASVSAIEGFYSRRTGSLLKFDEQSIIDYMTAQNMDPCGGGQPADVMELVAKQGRGRMCVKATPATPFDKCAVDTGLTGAGIVSLLDVSTQADRERRLCEALTQHGVLVTAVDAQTSWSSYASGILLPQDSKTPAVVNHAVILVGYDDDIHGDQWWLLQNTWSPGWGEEGYFRLPRGPQAAKFGADGPFGLYTYDPVYCK